MHIQGLHIFIGKTQEITKNQHSFFQLGTFTPLIGGQEFVHCLLVCFLMSVVKKLNPLHAAVVDLRPD